jgi:hypothetical protein
VASQCDRILWILGDGGWHEKSEFYGFCVLHSRVAELRQRGHSIEYRREGDRHLYRLASLRDPAGERLGPDAAGSHSEDGPLGGGQDSYVGEKTGGGLGTSSANTGSVCPPPSGEQLSLLEAA